MTIIINIKKQILTFQDEQNNSVAEYPISSGLKGLGEEKGSEKTPRGEHTIYQKIGESAPIFTVFRGRVPSGEIWSNALSEKNPDHDFVLTRIMWLSGVQTPIDRYIYIHGTSDENKIGTPQSHGCIRMKNKDVIDLFERVCVGERVLIKEEI